MSKPVADVAGLIQSYGPAYAPWVMALVTIGFMGWLMAHLIKLYVRNIAASAQHMRDVVATSESLRQTMLTEKIRCEEECRRLIREHSAAREIFLLQEREMMEAHRALQEELRMMKATVHNLTAELEAARGQTRRTDR